MPRYVFIVNQTSLVGEAYVAALTARFREKFDGLGEDAVDGVVQISLFDPLRPLLEPFVEHPKALDSACLIDDFASASDERTARHNADNQYATQRISLAEQILFSQQSLLARLAIKRLEGELHSKLVVLVNDIRSKEDLLLLKRRFPRCLCLLLTNSPESAIATDSLTTSMLETAPKSMRTEVGSSIDIVSKVSNRVSDIDFQRMLAYVTAE